MDLAHWRPWILLIEATIPTTTIPSHENWETLITSSNYEFAYFDGLNRFYVAKEHQELIEAFRLPPNIFDEYVFSREIDNQQFFENELLAKENAIQAQESAIQAKENAIQAQKRELEIKEKHIQDFQTSYAFWLKSGPLRRSPLLQALIHFRRNFLPKVGVLEQYLPKPFFVPASYAQASHVTPNQILPSIAIVTPSYNQGEFIERTIRSVLDQQYPHLEYIVQDGNSTDNTHAVLNSFQEKLTQFNSSQDNGQAHAINLGFQHTSGEIMAYLNSDDILLPGTLSYVADYFTRHPDVDVVYSHRIIINEQDQEIGRWVLPPHNDQSILWKDYIPQETLFWRRSLWEKIGGRMDESFQFALDWDLLIRFRTAGAKFSRLPRFLAAFRLHAGQKTSTQIHSVGSSEEQRLLKQVHGREVSREEIHQKMSPYLRRSIFYNSLYQMGIFRY
ncbi:MAG: glycosyltransferase [Anaerolineales bacterium]|nr:glycosyltransferase [Anaerolineales bacterium]